MADKTPVVSRTHAAATEQRSAARIPAARVPSIEGVRLSPNDVVSSLVNISTSGCLVECNAKPRPGSAVTVHFSGTFQPATVRGRVARTIVASLGKDGVLHYMVGIAFDAPIEVEEQAEVPAPPPQPVESPKAASRLQNRW
jgi:PilZ domain-containing protein